MVKKIMDQLEKEGGKMETLSEDEARALIEKKKFEKNYGVNPEGIIALMKELGYLQLPSIVEKEQKSLEPEVVSHRPKPLEFVEVNIDDEVKQQLEQNLFFEELEKDFFEGNEDFDSVYKKSQNLEKNKIKEGLEYYEEFEFLVRGGMEEIDRDWKSLSDTEEAIEEENNQLSRRKFKRHEKAKKISDIVESGIAYAVTELGWYGENISIEPTSEFDDIKRGVDDVMQIRREDNLDLFLALAVDVTFRGLLSDEYAEKFFSLLKSIAKGRKTRIKYFKNHQGEKMEEFAVPKIVLYFDRPDVKSLVEIVRNSDNPEMLEKLKSSPQKIALLNQVVAQCEVLSEVASDSHNDVFEQYDDFVVAVRRLGEKDPEIQAILEKTKETAVLKHMKFLVKEFKSKNRLPLAA